MTLDLQRLRDARAGEDAFVWGTGPSLNRTPSLPKAPRDRLTIDCSDIGERTAHCFLARHGEQLYLAGDRQCRRELNAQPCIKTPAFSRSGSCCPFTWDTICIHRLSVRLCDMKPKPMGPDQLPARQCHTPVVICSRFASLSGRRTAYLLGSDCTPDGTQYSHSPAELTMGRKWRDAPKEDPAAVNCEGRGPP